MNYTVPGQNTGVSIAFPFSRGSSQPRDQTRSPALQSDSLPAEPQGKCKNTEVGGLSLLRQIFLAQEPNRGLLHCRWILSQLSSQGKEALLKGAYGWWRGGERTADTEKGGMTGRHRPGGTPAGLCPGRADRPAQPGSLVPSSHLIPLLLQGRWTAGLAKG